MSIIIHKWNGTVVFAHFDGCKSFVKVNGVIIAENDEEECRTTFKVYA